MYLIVETGRGELVAMAGGTRGTSLRFAMQLARHHASERGEAMRVRDIHARGAGAVVYTQRPEMLKRRKACDCPAQCYGPELSRHSIRCRPARPACKWRREAAGHVTCDCPVYRFPHRAGAGRCNLENANAAVWGPTRAA
jgi:hypothetical protein